MSAAVHLCDIPFCDGTECGDVEAVTVPEPVRARPITGDGMAAIRKWVHQVERHFGSRNHATCYYASLIGYSAHLRYFTVTISDRALAEEVGMHKTRLSGHARKLSEAGFLSPGGTRNGGGKRARFTLAVPDVQDTDPFGAPY